MAPLETMQVTIRYIKNFLNMVLRCKSIKEIGCSKEKHVDKFNC